MTDLLRNRAIASRHIKVFVVDEADNMLDQQGLGDQTLRVKKYKNLVYCVQLGI
jgi:ATP-dependent RNA helicase DDX19/DBP5